MSGTRVIPCVVFAALIFFQVSVSAQSRVFVSGLATDSNSCSRAFPCRTFQQAFDVIPAGGENVALVSKRRISDFK